MREVDYLGTTDEEKEQVRKIKISTYLNIAACNIKTKVFNEAVSACDETLKLEPDNLKALYRRARATALPINAGVPELQKATLDLEKVIEIASRLN